MSKKDIIQSPSSWPFKGWEVALVIALFMAIGALIGVVFVRWQIVQQLPMVSGTRWAGPKFSVIYYSQGQGSMLTSVSSAICTNLQNVDSIAIDIDKP